MIQIIILFLLRVRNVPSIKHFFVDAWIQKVNILLLGNILIFINIALKFLRIQMEILNI